MENKTFTEIVQFIEKERWEYPFELKSTTCFEKDLKITGDDAVEFLEAFAKQFNIDISNLEFEKYFYPEGDKLLPWLISLFKGKKKREMFKLTVEDLEKAVKKGELK